MTSTASRTVTEGPTVGGGTCASLRSDISNPLEEDLRGRTLKVLIRRSCDSRVARSLSHQYALSCVLADLLLAKDLVNEGDRNRSFADRGRDTFDVAAAYVSDGEDAGTARFEEERWSCQRPFRAREFLG